MKEKYIYFIAGVALGYGFLSGFFLGGENLPEVSLAKPCFQYLLQKGKGQVYEKQNMCLNVLEITKMDQGKQK